MASQSQYVYKGLWTDYDSSKISGGRITMTQDSAKVINIFTGIFITLIEGGMWAMIAYTIYHYQGRRTTNDALHLQKQVILRNSPTDLPAAFSSVSLWAVWKNRWGSRASTRTVGIFVGAILNFAFFVGALPFITTLLSTGNSVLVQSPSCGFWEDSAALRESAFQAVMTNRTWTAVNYVDNCYNTNRPSSLCDDNLMQRKITWQRNAAYGCPFMPVEICSSTTYHAFMMESGIIDSHRHLGINGRPKDRMQLRRLTTCAVLDTTNFTSKVNDTITGRQFEAFNFGSRVGHIVNYTTSASPDATASEAGYVLESYSAFAFNRSIDPTFSTFNPVPALQNLDGDVTLSFLANLLGDAPSQQGGHYLTTLVSVVAS